MNRRAFLLGTIATPIAAKVNAVSAALRPIATKVYSRSPRMLAMSDLKARNEYHQGLIDLIFQSNELMDHIAGRDPPPLDRPSEPCDASIAGRDQIG